MGGEMRPLLLQRRDDFVAIDHGASIPRAAHSHTCSTRTRLRRAAVVLRVAVRLGAHIEGMGLQR
jgi:hypothetical protein